MPPKVQWVEAVHSRLRPSWDSRQKRHGPERWWAAVERESGAAHRDSTWQEEVGGASAASAAGSSALGTGGAVRPPGTESHQDPSRQVLAETFHMIREDLGVALANFEPQRFTLVVEGRPVQVTERGCIVICHRQAHSEKRKCSAMVTVAATNTVVTISGNGDSPVAFRSVTKSVARVLNTAWRSKRWYFLFAYVCL